MIAASYGRSYLANLSDLLFLPENRSRLLCMFAAYLDASGKTSDIRKPGDPAIALAGYVAPTRAWLNFARKWKKFLGDFGLTLAHHKDFVQGVGEYAGWGEKKRRAYVKRGAYIINQSAHHGFAVATLLKDYARATNSTRADRAFIFVAIRCMDLVAMWAERSGIQEPIAYFFEAGDGHDGDLLKIRRQMLAQPRAKEIYRFKSLTIVEKDDPEFTQLQAADWLAWEAGKYLKDTKLKPEEPRDARQSLLKLAAPGKLETIWYDEKRLIRLAEEKVRRRGSVVL